MDGLHRNARARLTALFPCTLDDWLEPTESISPIASESTLFPQARRALVLPALVLARELDLTHLLHLSHDVRLPLLATPAAAAVFQADKITILSGVQRRRTAHRKILARWLDSPLATRNGCRSQNKCGLARLERLATDWRGTEEGAHWRWQETWEDGLCRACANAGEETQADSVQEMWEGIPGLFDMPTWEEMVGA